MKHTLLVLKLSTDRDTTQMHFPYWPWQILQFWAHVDLELCWC